MFQIFRLILWDKSFDFDCWLERADVQQEMKAVELLDCWLFYLQIRNKEIVLLANSGQMKVNRHPGLQKARQAIFYKDALVDL